MLGVDPIILGLNSSVHVLSFISFLIFVCYYFSERTLETHAMVGIIGYHMFYISTLLWYFGLNAPLSTIGILFCSLIFIFMSTGMANRNHGCSNTAHNWFAWLSFAFTVVLFLCLITSKYIYAFTYNDDYICVFLGVFAIIFATITLISGMMYTYIDWANRCLYITHICLIIVYVSETIGIVLFLLYS